MLSTDAKRRQTCRTLFDTATSDGGKLGTRDQVERLRDDCSRTWNYDFGADRPRQGGRYEWQKMQDGRPGDEAQARRPQETGEWPGSGRADRSLLHFFFLLISFRIVFLFLLRGRVCAGVVRKGCTSWFRG